MSVSNNPGLGPVQGSSENADRTATQVALPKSSIGHSGHVIPPSAADKDLNKNVLVMGRIDRELHSFNSIKNRLTDLNQTDAHDMGEIKTKMGEISSKIESLVSKHFGNIIHSKAIKALESELNNLKLALEVKSANVEANKTAQKEINAKIKELEAEKNFHIVFDKCKQEPTPANKLLLENALGELFKTNSKKGIENASRVILGNNDPSLNEIFYKSVISISNQGTKMETISMLKNLDVDDRHDVGKSIFHALIKQSTDNPGGLERCLGGLYEYVLEGYNSESAHNTNLPISPKANTLLELALKVYITDKPVAGMKEAYSLLNEDDITATQKNTILRSILSLENLPAIIEKFLKSDPDMGVKLIIKLIPMMPESAKKGVYKALVQLPENMKNQVAKILIDHADVSDFKTILKGVLNEEMPSQNSPQTLFRSNSLYTKMMTTLMQKEMNTPQNNPLGPIIDKFKKINSNPAYQLDREAIKTALKLKDPTDRDQIDNILKENQYLVQKWAKEFFKVINTDLIPKLPLSIREMLSDVYEQVSAKFGPEVAKKEVMASLMLRYIAPTILDSFEGRKPALAIAVTSILQKTTNQTKVVDDKQVISSSLYESGADTIVGKLAVNKAYKNFTQYNNDANKTALQNALTEYFSFNTSKYIDSTIKAAFDSLGKAEQRSLAHTFPNAKKIMEMSQKQVIEHEKFEKQTFEMFGFIAGQPPLNGGVPLVKEILQGRGSAKLTPPKVMNYSNGKALGAKGGSPGLLLEDQFVRDFPRSVITHNGKMILDGASNVESGRSITRLKEEIAKLKENDAKIQDLRKQLKGLEDQKNKDFDTGLQFLQKLSDEQGEQALRNISSLLVQTTSTDIATDLFSQFSPIGLKTNGDSVAYDINIDNEGNAYLTIEVNYTVQNADADNQKFMGNIRSKREIIIPKAELNVDWVKNPVQNSQIQVKDSYTASGLTAEQLKFNQPN